MTDRDADRRAVAHDLRLAESGLSSVSMSLGWWAGNGDWATYSDASRDKAGARALADLDVTITMLAVVRDHLAAALAEQATDTDDDFDELVLPMAERGAATRALYEED